MQTATVDINFQRHRLESNFQLFNRSLIYHQQEFELNLAEYKLNRISDVHREQLIVKSGSNLVISTTLDSEESFQPCLRTTNNLDQFKAWIGMSDSLFEQGVFSQTEDLPLKSWTPKPVTDKSKLTPTEQQEIERASYNYIFGNSKLVESYKEIVETLHAPFEIAVCAIKKVVIEPGSSLIIQGSRPAVLIFGELEIIEDGQVKIYAPTNMTVQKLCKISH